MAEQKLARALSGGTMHHAWLITGPAGVGKATLAYRLIRTILGGQPNTLGQLDVPEGDAAAARVQSLGHGDFILLRRPYDQKSKKLRTEIPVAETRRLQEFFSRKSAEGGWRVCLIDSADDMNVAAANGVLKTLEEPPEKALIILLSSNPGKLLPTIRSRCLHLPLRDVDTSKVQSWLVSRGFDEQAANMAALLSRGAPGRAFALAENAAEVLRPLASLLSALPSGNAKAEHRIADALALPKSSNARTLFWDALTDVVQAQAVYAGTGEWTSAFAPLKLSRPPQFWLSLWDELREKQRMEAALNMDKKTVMLSAMAALRTA